MPVAALPLIESHHPATFQSRGVAAPFTTPLLAGARVRQSRHAGIELVVPSPSGGRGVYIVQWPGVRALCSPSIHDTMLFRRCAMLHQIDSPSVRIAALDVALEGHAGRDALHAAEIAVAADRSECLLAHFLLLASLIEQVEPSGIAYTSVTERTPAFDRRASVLLHRISPSFGLPAAELAGRLAAMGDAFAPVGVGHDDRVARIPRLIALLRETCAALLAWLDAELAHDLDGLGRAVTTAMGGACESGEAILAAARSPLADPATLLKAWCADPTGPGALAKRCDSLLDGWERVALLWLSAATNASRRATLLEMIPLMPVLPREVMTWPDIRIRPEALEPACRVTSREDTWRRGGAAFALIERNEKLRAMSL